MYGWVRGNRIGSLDLGAGSQTPQRAILYTVHSGRSVMFEYMTAQEAAEKWNVSLRRVQWLCRENRIEGVLDINRVWLFPKDTKKPADARRKKRGN